MQGNSGTKANPRRTNNPGENKESSISNADGEEPRSGWNTNRVLSRILGNNQKPLL